MRWGCHNGREVENIQRHRNLPRVKKICMVEMLPPATRVLALDRETIFQRVGVVDRFLG